MSDPGPLPTRRIAPPATYKASRTSARIRRLVQITAMAFFLYVLLATRQDVKSAAPQNLFFLSDPLAAIAAMLGGRSLVLPMLIGGTVMLALGVALGRAWCGWVCPLGTVLDWMPARRPEKENRNRERLWRQGKNLTLAVIFISALLGSLTLVALDPVTLFFRTCAAVLLPLLNSVFLALDKALYNIGPLQPAVAWFDTAVRINLLGESRFYLPNLTLLVIFGSVLALNFFSSRAWCRYLCPLGGLLGLVSRISLVRRRVEAGGCISCGRCAAVCHTGAVDAAQGFHSNPADCTNCLDCSGVCPTRVISFGAGAPAPVAFQPARRQFIGAAGLAVIGAVAVRFLPSPERKLPRAIRPPGATEESMTGKCIRCGECVRVCPTGAIQPVNSASAWPYTWTPHLELRRGYCDYACNACGQVCPTGAVSNLTLEKKRKEIIGIAVIDEKRCIPFKDKKECIVCEEMCPLAPKAVTLKQGDWPVGRPIVDEKLCNGCGICEHQCPVKGESAIKIYRSLEVAPKPAPEAQNG